jgi:putative transposase
LKDEHADMATTEAWRRHGISLATFYRCKLKFGGLEVSGVRRLRSLDEANSQIKILSAEAMLDNTVLKGAGNS